MNLNGDQALEGLEYPKVLTIAGSDSGGGAGIQADIKTIAALGCFGMSAITALTAQNTVGVRAIYNIPIEMVQAQIDAVVDDIGVDAVKIGMLHSHEVIAAVANVVKERSFCWVVHDPVMVSATGAALIDQAAKSSLSQLLIPQVDLLTPNVDEAELLLDRSLKSAKELVQAAKDILLLGAGAVLLKGAHLLEADVVDVLAVRNSRTGGVEITELVSPRIDTHNLHGSGCTLSAAVASYLALGLGLTEAVQAARVYVMAAIKAGTGIRTGAGTGPLNHAHAPIQLKARKVS